MAAAKWIFIAVSILHPDELLVFRRQRLTLLFELFLLLYGLLSHEIIKLLRPFFTVSFHFLPVDL